MGNGLRKNLGKVFFDGIKKDKVTKHPINFLTTSRISGDRRDPAWANSTSVPGNSTINKTENLTKKPSFFHFLTN